MGIIIKDIKIPDSSYLFLEYEKRDGNIREIKSDVLKNLSKVNIFVGENNCGKSRLLRSIVKTRDYESNPNFTSNEKGLEVSSDLKELDELNKFILKLINTIEDILNTSINNGCLRDFISGTGFEFLISNIKPIDYLKPNDNIFKHLYNLKDNANGWKNGGCYFTPHNLNNIPGFRGIGFSSGMEKFLENMAFGEIGSKIVDVFEEYSPDFEKMNFDFKRIYIPILRGLRPINYGELHTPGRKLTPRQEGFDEFRFFGDVYKVRTNFDYQLEVYEAEDNKLEDIDVFTGLGMYKKILKYKNHHYKERALINEFENYLSENFFDGKKVELIAKIEDKGFITVKIGDEKEKPIYHLGDGIQSIIIMTFPLFLYKDKIEENENVLVFIEEPEHLLHPGLQRKFIETILTREGFENFQFFFSTHSNHLLDITFDFRDISIFTLKKELNGNSNEKDPSFLVENISNNDSSALDLLGVRNSSVFLSNCTIWVEGITDRYYIKKYFDIYQKYLKKKAKKLGIPFILFREDYHYSFVEYSGGNIIHWSFLDDENDLEEKEKIYVERLCGKVFLVADSDNAKIIPDNYEGDIESDFTEKERRLKKLKDHLGNRFYLLKSKEIENILKKEVLIEVVKEFEKAGGAGEDDLLELDKLKEDPNFDEEIYGNENLGEFIDDFIGENKKRDASYRKGNTISEKQKFCLRALNYINGYDELSEEAITLCDNIYQFIAYNHGYRLDNYCKICDELDIPHELIDFNEVSSNKKGIK